MWVAARSAILRALSPRVNDARFVMGGGCITQPAPSEKSAVPSAFLPQPAPKHRSRGCVRSLRARGYENMWMILFFCMMKVQPPRAGERVPLWLAGGLHARDAARTKAGVGARDASRRAGLGRRARGEKAVSEREGGG